MHGSGMMNVMTVLVKIVDLAKSGNKEIRIRKMPRDKVKG